MLDYVMDICSLAARIEENVKRDIDFAELEKAVGYSYHHIRGFFRQAANVSLSRYILARKIAHAAFELRHSNKSVTEIAEEYGFSSIDTFTRAFRRGTGMTPSQFKKAEYLCGRRIICAGVYAPVILGLDNPIFTLRHLKEVNEMSEMKKTKDSCVLYGVPKVHFGREADGKQQNSPFPMCLQSVLNYMGQNISYTEIMAYSGAAFRQRWDSNGWNVAAVDIRFIYENHLAAFERAFNGAGRKVVISENPDMPKEVTKSDAINLIKSELDCGRPVIALGVVGPPEACIVTGYRNNGETLLGWSLFQDFWGNCTADESGYFIKDNWWDETEAIMSVGEEIGSRAADKEVLENALMLMTTEEMPTYGGEDIFYGGQAAYEAWAEALESDDFPGFGEVGDCQGDAERMLGEDRRYAADYMVMMAEKYPKLAAEFNECARLLNAAADCVPSMREIREGNNPDNIKTRIQIAALVRQAAKHEKAACAVLKETIGKLYRELGEAEVPPAERPSGRKYNINLSSLIPSVNFTQALSIVNADGNYKGKGTQKHWMKDGKLIITSDYDVECMQTVKGFTLPLRIDVDVMTCGGDIRLYYLMGEIIFNLHCEEFHDHDIITGEWQIHKKPLIPPDKFVKISWIIEKEFMEVYVDGELYHRRDNMPYIRILKKASPVSKIIAPIRISAANQSTITVKSLTVTKK